MGNLAPLVPQKRHHMGNLAPLVPQKLEEMFDWRFEVNLLNQIHNSGLYRTKFDTNLQTLF